MPDQSELLLRLTKGRHAASGSLKKVLDGLVSRKTSITWDTVSPLVPGFMRRNVDATMDYAAKLKPFANLVGASAPAPAPGPSQPEIHGESAPWLQETDEDEFTEEELLAAPQPGVDELGAPVERMDVLVFVFVVGMVVIAHLSVISRSSVRMASRSVVFA